MRTWCDAFAAQAASDLAVYELLSREPVASCHRLHYLQMWLEKLCKTYVHTAADLDELKGTHNVVAKILPRLIDKHWRDSGFENSPKMAEIKSLCREIDLLHPSVDDGKRRPENVEYPWPGKSGGVEVPANYKFPLLGRLYTSPGKILLKVSTDLTRKLAALIR